MQTPGSKSRGFVSIVRVMAFVLMLAGATYSQSGNGSVRGSVRDQTDSVIPGARLSLTNNATNVTIRTVSNQAGLYTFPSLIPGAYTLTAEFAGMETLQVSLEVQVQVSTTFNAVLRPGSTETKINVSAEVVPLATTDNGTLGHVLERQRIEQLPLNGRDVQQLLQTVPGLEIATANQVRSWGMMAGAHGYYLDGAVLEESMWEEGTIIRPPGLDTIQEFKVENGASSAKFSRMTSVILSTKSGTNRLHGAAFETNRDNAYGLARSRTDQNAANFPTLHRNEFGASLGGPVYIPKIYNGKNRTFFFFSYEASRRNAPFSMNTSVPTAAMRNGDYSGLLDSQGRLSTLYDPWTTGADWSRLPFSYGGKINNIDPSRLSPLAKYMYSVIPMPTNNLNPLLTSNWYGTAPDNTNEITTATRLDHRFTDKDQAYTRFSIAPHNRIWDAYGDTVPTLDKVANWESDYTMNSSVALNWVHTFSPTLFNEFAASLAHTWRDRYTGDGVTKYDDTLGLPNPFDQVGFPYIQNVGFGNTNYLRPYNRNKFVYNYWIFDDNATKIVGKHEFQFGVHVRYDLLDTIPQLVFYTGQVDFNNCSTCLYDPTSAATNPLPTALTGSNLANTYLGLATYSNPLRKGLFKLRRPEYAGYFQDNIKVTSRWTVNLGLRWQLSPFISEADNVPIPGFDIANHAIVTARPLDQLYTMKVTTPSIIQAYQNIGVKFETAKQAGQPASGAHSNWHDWSPHLGTAYRAGDGAKSLVVRAGFGRSYFNDGIWTWMDQSSAATPYTASFQNCWLYCAAQAPDGIGNYGMRSVPTIVAGANSRNAVDLNNPNGITPGSTYNYFFPSNMPTNYVDDWNVTFEKEFLSNTLLRFGYVGNHGGNQGMSYSFNDNVPAYIWYATTQQAFPTGLASNTAMRPYDQSGYGTLVVYNKLGYSNYSGAQFGMERRYSRGLAYQISYVVGNTFRMGDAESGGGYTSLISSPSNYLPGAVPAVSSPTDVSAIDKLSHFLLYRRDYSSPKHRVRWNWIYDLPFGRGKAIGRNAKGVVNGLIAGWQLAGIGTLNSTYLSLPTANYTFTGEPIHQYGYDDPVLDCRSGTCQRGYLWINTYIPANQINQTNSAGQCIGVCGVPANYKPFATPVIPWGTTAAQPNMPAGTNVATYWDTNTVWVPLNNGTVVRTTYNPNLNPLRNQYIPGPRQWSQDVSMFKNFKIRESMNVRFTFDAFNVFNHPNNIGSNGVSDGFGAGILSQAGQANPARQLQLSARFAW